MFNLHCVNMFFVIFLISISTYSTVLCDCEDGDTGPIYSSYDEAPVVYREFPANYSVRPYCSIGQQMTEVLMMPTCNAKNIPVYPIPDCGELIKLITFFICLTKEIDSSSLQWNH